MDSKTKAEIMRLEGQKVMAIESDDDLINELERRGWNVTKTPIAVGCCGKGKKVVMTWHPY